MQNLEWVQEGVGQTEHEKNDEPACVDRHEWDAAASRAIQLEREPVTEQDGEQRPELSRGQNLHDHGRNRVGTHRSRLCQAGEVPHVDHVHAEDGPPA